MKSAHLTGYSLKNGQLIYISEVPRGLACGCVCVVCRQQLIAKKGLQRCHHFAHLVNTKCHGAAETALHLLSKELLATLDTITIPAYNFVKEKTTGTGANCRYQELIVKGGLVRISSAKIESSETGFKPDVILDCGTKSLIIEIAVTHRVDRAKMRHIRRRELPAIEIQLEPIDALLSKKLLSEKLQNDLASKHWLFHPKQREAERRFFSKLRQIRKDDRFSRKAVLSLVKRTQSPSSDFHVLSSTFSRNAYDKTAEEFNKKNGRYPTSEECLRLWPHLYKK